MILCDLDSILADILTPWLAAYTKEYEDTLTIPQITGWAFHNFVKPECGYRIYQYLSTPNFFADLVPLPGAVEAVQKIIGMGHDFLVVTAGAAVDDAATQKIRWCKRYLGLAPKQVIVTPRKELIRGDLLIDDSPEQIAKYRRAWPKTPIFAIAYPYNLSADCARFSDWTDTAHAWANMVRGICALEPAAGAVT